MRRIPSFFARLRNELLRLLLVQHLKRAHAIAQANQKPPPGLLGLVRARQEPHQAVSGCGGMRDPLFGSLDGRGADEVSWDAT